MSYEAKCLELVFCARGGKSLVMQDLEELRGNLKSQKSSERSTPQREQL